MCLRLLGANRNPFLHAKTAEKDAATGFERMYLRRGLKGFSPYFAFFCLFSLLSPERHVPNSDKYFGVTVLVYSKVVSFSLFFGSLQLALT